MTKHSSAAIPAPLRQTAEAVLGDARAALDGTVSGSPTQAIHAFRVALKRWRALLRLLEGLLDEDPRELRREAARAARALGGSRDAQAALDALADIAATSAPKLITPGSLVLKSIAVDSLATEPPALASPALSERGVAALTAQLEEKRHAEEFRVSDRQTIDRLKTAIARAAEESAAWPLESIEPSQIARELSKSYRRARARMPEDWRATSAHDIHRFRQAVVTFRYQLEIVESSWPRVWRAYIAETQKLRAQLGKTNDLAVLEKLLASNPSLVRWRARLRPAIRRRRQDHLDQAAEIALRVFSDSPAAFRRHLEALLTIPAHPAPV
jgi:CHAD domain-containing protein